MKAFSVLFQERNSPIIIYNGKTVYRYLRCTEKGKYILKFGGLERFCKKYSAAILLKNTRSLF